MMVAVFDVGGGEVVGFRLLGNCESAIIELIRSPLRTLETRAGSSYALSSAILTFNKSKEPLALEDLKIVFD